jgi:hypothetical protein
MPRTDRERSITGLRWALVKNGFSGGELETYMALLSSESITESDSIIIYSVLDDIWSRQIKRDSDAYSVASLVHEMATDSLAEKLTGPLVAILRALPAERVRKALFPFFPGNPVCERGTTSAPLKAITDGEGAARTG